MLRVNNDENAAVPTGLHPLKSARSEKKSHKTALGDVMNTMHNTPMRATPKTPFQGQLKFFAKSPVNQMVTSTQSLKKSFLASGGASLKSVKKPKRKHIHFAPELIDYDDNMPESVYKDEPSVMNTWTQMNCPTNQEIASLIELTLNHHPKENPPKYNPYEEDELMIPPPSPADSADFPFDAPPMTTFDIPDADFAQLTLD